MKAPRGWDPYYCVTSGKRRCLVQRKVWLLLASLGHILNRELIGDERKRDECQHPGRGLTFVWSWTSNNHFLLLQPSQNHHSWVQKRTWKIVMFTAKRRPERSPGWAALPGCLWHLPHGISQVAGNAFPTLISQSSVLLAGPFYPCHRTLSLAVLRDKRCTNLCISWLCLPIKQPIEPETPWVQLIAS